MFSKLRKPDEDEIPIPFFVNRLMAINGALNKSECNYFLCKTLIFLVFRICRIIDQNDNGDISIDEFLAYFDPATLEEEEAQDIYEYIWPEWVKKSNKVYLAKEILLSIVDSIEKQNIPPWKAFNIYDANNDGTVTFTEFTKILKKICPNLSKAELYIKTKKLNIF